MANNEFRTHLNNILNFISEKVDLDRTRFQQAEKSYQAVSDWLGGSSSDLNQLEVDFFSQGSFSLGTIVKPLVEDFDLDFVCLLNKGLDLTSQEAYQIVGERLKENTTYKDILEQKNRCWRLNYAGDFHMDIVPAIPDNQSGRSAILVPDKYINNWTASNPKGYIVWFQSMVDAQSVLNPELTLIKKTHEVEGIPEYYRKNQLQKIIQLLKRHRDVMFENDHNNIKPISIIITTLAGLSYGMNRFNNDLFDSMIQMVKFFPNLVKATSPRIPNPVNSYEDFADKWKEYPEREVAFFEWLSKLEEDLELIAFSESNLIVRDHLAEIFKISPESFLQEKTNEYESKKNSGSIFNVGHRQDPSKKWKMDLKLGSSVNIRGYVQQSEFKKVEFASNCSPLQKNLSIYFLASTNNIEGNYEVHWQVVNTGDEAKNAGGLRGGFYGSSDDTEDRTSRKRKESTSYTGSHWIEAFIVKNGVCLARSGEFIVNIQ